MLRASTATAILPGVVALAVSAAGPASYAADQGGEAGTASALSSSAATSGTLLVELVGLQSDEGSVVYAVWADRDSWLGPGAVREGTSRIDDGVSRVVLEDLPFGEYAISVYHDKNGNNRLDTGFMRIPKEPIGTSNNPKARFGPPKYDDATFTLDAPTKTITIAIEKLF